MYYLIEIRQLLRLDLNFKTMFKSVFKTMFITVFKIVFKTVFKIVFKTVFKTVFKPMLKIMFNTVFEKKMANKNMSFLKITDSKKRDFIVNEFIKTRQNIQQNFLSERLGDSSTQHELSKLFKPVTDMQKDLKEGLVSEL